MIDPRLTELAQVEESFLRQLERLGWRILRGDKYDPASTERESFHEVIIEGELRAALAAATPRGAAAAPEAAARTAQSRIGRRCPGPAGAGSH